MAPSVWKRATGIGAGDATAPTNGLSDVAIGMISLSGSLLVFGGVLFILLLRARRDERKRFELRERRRQVLTAKILSARASSSEASTIPPIPTQARVRSPTVVRLKALAVKPHNPILIDNRSRLYVSPRQGQLPTSGEHDRSRGSSRMRTKMESRSSRQPCRHPRWPSNAHKREYSAPNPPHPDRGRNQLGVSPVQSSNLRAMVKPQASKQCTKMKQLPMQPGKPHGPSTKPLPTIAGRLANKKSPHPDLWKSESSTSIRARSSGILPGSVPPPLPAGAGALKPRNGSWGLTDLHRNWPGSFSSTSSSHTSILGLGAFPRSDNRWTDDTSELPDDWSDESGKSIIGLSTTISEGASVESDRKTPRFQIFRESISRKFPKMTMPLGYNDFAKGFNPLQINWGDSPPTLPPPLRIRSPLSSSNTGQSSSKVQPQGRALSGAGIKTGTHQAQVSELTPQVQGRATALPYGPRPMPQQASDHTSTNSSGRQRKGMNRPKDVRLVKEDSFTVHQMSLARQPDLSPIPSVSDLSNTPGLASLGDTGLDLNFNGYTLHSLKDGIDAVKGVPRSSPKPPLVHGPRAASRLSFCSTPKTPILAVAELEDTSPQRAISTLNGSVEPAKPGISANTEYGFPMLSATRLGDVLSPITSSSCTPVLPASIVAIPDVSVGLGGSQKSIEVGPRTARLPPLQLSSHDSPSPFPSLAASSPSPLHVSALPASVQSPPRLHTWGNAIVRKGSLEDSDFELATQRSSSATKPPSIISGRAAAATVRSSVMALRRMNSTSSFQSERWNKLVDKTEDSGSPNGGVSRSASPVTTLGRRMLDLQHNRCREREESPLGRRSKVVEESERARRRERATKRGEMQLAKNGVARWTSIGRSKLREQSQAYRMRDSIVDDRQPKSGTTLPVAVPKAQHNARNQKKRSSGHPTFDIGSSPLAWKNEKLAGMAC